MGPGLYSDIGKKARDLLYRDFQTDQKFTITTYTANGVAITATGTKKSDFLIGEIHSQLKNKNVTVDVKANSESNVLTTVTLDDFGTPGLKAIISTVLPDQRSGKVELQYLHDFTGINASVGLTANPVVNFAGVVGTDKLTFGADVSLDTGTGNLTKYNAAISLTNADLITSLNLYNNGDLLSASYYHLVNPVANMAVAAELTHSFSTNENTLIFGTQHSLDPLTTIKTRVNNFGKAGAVIQHQWRPKSFVTLSAEVDTKALEKSSKVGLSLLLKP
ncbi:Mitochondrial outer membrane porin [Platanthera zijinensis]|uniref:Mitochondrial outer membrane porin n=1 Tax=Platanthera zijinensis TaxID=2320716 RepID=A0AAP0G062_9ASPA